MSDKCQHGYPTQRAPCPVCLTEHYRWEGAKHRLTKWQIQQAILETQERIRQQQQQ